MAADTRAAADASACLVISARVLIASSVWACARDRISHGGFAIAVDPVTCRNPKKLSPVDFPKLLADQLAGADILLSRETSRAVSIHRLGYQNSSRPTAVTTNTIVPAT